jgi:hypothetical protein
MRARLDGWTLMPHTDGIALHSPRGARAAAIRVRERIRPLQGVGSLVTTAAAELGCAPAAIARLVTDEGEHAALVTLVGAQSERTLGFVFGDDSFTLVDARAAWPEHFREVRAAVERLVREHTLGLGERRCRRFDYRAPIGWTPVPRGLTTRWCAGDAVLTVSPARPAGASDTMLDEMLAEAGAIRPLGTPGVAPAQGSGGLAGAMWRFRARRREAIIEVAAVRLRDDRFDYALRLEAGRLGPYEEALQAVVQSVRAVPRPRAPRTLDLNQHWAA